MSSGTSGQRALALRVAKWLVERGRPDQAVALLAAWAANGPNDAEGQALLAEALALGERGGLDRATMLDVILQSAVASPLIGYKRDMLVRGDFTPAFSVSQMMKDIDIILSVGRADHVPLPVNALVRQIYEQAYRGGRGEADFFALVEDASRA